MVLINQPLWSSRNPWYRWTSDQFPGGTAGSCVLRQAPASIHQSGGLRRAGESLGMPREMAANTWLIDGGYWLRYLWMVGHAVWRVGWCFINDWSMMLEPDVCNLMALSDPTHLESTGMRSMRSMCHVGARVSGSHPPSLSTERTPSPVAKWSLSPYHSLVHDGAGECW